MGGRKEWAFTELAQNTARNLLIDDPQSNARIDREIERNRKGDGVIEVITPDFKQLERARIRLKQVRHEFHFGCNGFMLDQFRDGQKDADYRLRFTEIFNLAVLPFYWKDTEPERGRPRFDRDSPYIYRRPPTDLLLEFCEEHGITPKGHPLCWHSFNFLPEWAALDRTRLAEEIEQRIEEIAARYGKRIPIWDVCNEALGLPAGDVNRRVPARHVEMAFEVASRCLPRSSVLMYNDYICWENHGDYTPLYMLCRHLLGLPGVNLGGIGLQYHMFSPIERMHEEGAHKLNTRNILDMLDLYGKLGLPLSLSEITISAHKAFGDGPAFQQRLVEHLYRLWFSHEAVSSIIYWNMVDDTAFVYKDANCTWNENDYKGGLLNADLSPKPAYETLRRLIREEWVTPEQVLEFSAGEFARFRGFYGDYDVAVETEAGTFNRTIRLSKGSINHFRMMIK